MQRKILRNSDRQTVSNRTNADDGSYMPARAFSKENGEQVPGTGILSRKAVLDSLEEEAPVQRVPNRTGLSDNLKSGMEQLSGMDLSHVRVQRNSPEPARVGAHAYTRGSEIHLAPGQDRHLPHELGHVVQQAQGRVKPTGSVAGMPLNDDTSLESEADRMGDAASRMGA